MFEDKMAYDSNSVEIDCLGRPRYRILTHFKGLASTRVMKAIIPAKSVFNHFPMSVLGKSSEVVQSAVNLQPSNRGFVVVTSSQKFLYPWLAFIKKQLPAFVTSQTREGGINIYLLGNPWSLLFKRWIPGRIY